MSSSIKKLQEIIGYTFNQDEILVQALTHPSFSSENRSTVGDNQRLEFLGDAVIQIVITSKIYHLFPELPEGELTKIRSALTKEGTLATFARNIQLGNYLFLGHGEKLNKGNERDSILCDAFESLIGAIYIDDNNDLSPIHALINQMINLTFGSVDIKTLIQKENPKGLLQEWSQKHANEIPVYELVEASGPDHEKIFTVAVSINHQRCGIGKAGKRQTAEEIAARSALEKAKQDGF
jgi:ribonuclease III